MTSSDDSEQSVEITVAPHGDVAHIMVDEDPLCPRNLRAEYENATELPENGLCENCKRIGKMTGIVEVPATRLASDGGQADE